MYANGLWLDLLTLGSSLASPACQPPVAFLSLTFGRRPDLAVCVRVCVCVLISFFVAPPNGQQQKGQASKHIHTSTYEDKRVMAMVICKVIMAINGSSNALTGRMLIA